jgi:hypothetical protein
MAAPGEKLFCVLEYHMSKFVVTVQRAFRAKYAKQPPTDKTIRAWYKQFTKTGWLKGTDHCSSEEYRCNHADACVAKLEYHIDVCRVTRGAHIEHL